MMEPTLIVMLDAKPASCTDEPEGPWAADVVVEEDDDERERSARWFAADALTGPHWEGPYGDAPQYRATAGETTYHVQECDVDGVIRVSDLPRRDEDAPLLRPPESVVES